MDDTSRQLNRTVVMKHAAFQRAGNRNMTFPAIVEYPFFTRSEPSNGVQLADLLAYSVYRAFKDEDSGYPYFFVWARCPWRAYRSGLDPERTLSTFSEVTGRS